MAEVVIHLSWEGGTTFTLDDEYVVRRDGEVLGEQGGDFTAFVIDLDGEPHVLVAGTPFDRDTRYVCVNEHPVPVHTGAAPSVWMAPPLPCKPGGTVTVVGRTELDGDELWRLESPPLIEGANPPVFGPGWVGYAPL
jgi:hypothetical protein